jgi:hypothetical protein
MEAKVDIRKLQILNDRITQTIDALNQVRLTVHGLAHTSPQMTPFTSGLGIGTPGIGQQGFASQGFGVPFGTSPLSGLGVPGFQAHPGFLGAGLQHTTPFGIPSGFVNPLIGALQSGYTPYVPSLAGGINPAIGIPQTFGQVGGLFHSNPEAIEHRLLEFRASDPYRIASTFPYVLAPQSPVAGIW